MNQHDLDEIEKQLNREMWSAILGLIIYLGTLCVVAIGVIAWLVPKIAN